MAPGPLKTQASVDKLERALRRARREYDHERADGGATMQSILSAQDRWWAAKLALDAALQAA